MPQVVISLNTVHNLQQLSRAILPGPHSWGKAPPQGHQNGGLQVLQEESEKHTFVELQGPFPRISQGAGVHGVSVKNQAPIYIYIYIYI